MRIRLEECDIRIIITQKNRLINKILKVNKMRRKGWKKSLLYTSFYFLFTSLYFLFTSLYFFFNSFYSPLIHFLCFPFIFLLFSFHMLS